jgi:hypothetical protein
MTKKAKALKARKQKPKIFYFLYYISFAGAVLMTKLAPKWLKRENSNEREL